MERGEKRARRKSRKISETEQAVEEPSLPAKRRKKGSSGKLVAGPTPQEARKGKGGAERPRKKRFLVSFDVVENNLSVGDEARKCTLTVSNALDGKTEEDVVPTGAVNVNGAGDADARTARPPVKFKKPDFSVSQPSRNLTMRALIA